MLDLKDSNQGKTEDMADKANAPANQVRHTVRATGTEPEGSPTGGVGESAKEMVQAVAANASELAGKVKDTAQQWASSVGGAAVQAKDKAVELSSAAVSKAGDIGQDLTSLIRRRPLQALLVGLGVGFGVGFLVARASRTAHAGADRHLNLERVHAEDRWRDDGGQG